MIFETHAHYDDESFNDDREALIRSLPEKGIGRIINVGASIETTKTTLELAAKYDYIYAAVGVHPSDISGLNEETFAWLKEQASLPKTVAIGEIGLDYYWDKEPEVQNAQRYWFRRQMELALSLIHISEPTRRTPISYAVFCLKKKIPYGKPWYA